MDKHSELVLFILVIYTGVVRCSVKWYAIGDWGDPVSTFQDQVAAVMNQHADAFKPEFILTLGDNFYPNGIDSIEDPKINSLWRQMYNLTYIKHLPWWISLGNHDYGLGLGEEWVQVELDTVDPLWNLPHLWYDFIRSDGQVSVHFIIIDTEALGKRLNNYTDMMTWLDNTLRTTTADWVLVHGHHPVYSVGLTGPVLDTFYQELLPVLERYPGVVDVYFAGHDHNMQHLQKQEDPDYLDFLISGAGGSELFDEETGYDDILLDQYNITLRSMHVIGAFAAIEATPTSLMVSFVDLNTDIIYSYTRTRYARAKTDNQERRDYSSHEQLCEMSDTWTHSHGSEITYIEASSTIRWYAIGDWGEPFLDKQERVAEAMSIHAGEFQPEFIVSQGDNFYPDGITSVDDPRVDSLWRQMYNLTNIRGLEWWISLGNHDYGKGEGEEWVQVELGEIDPLWKLPYLWYDFIVSDGDVSVHFIVIDTEALGQRLNNYTAMVTWLDKTLNSTTSDWVIVNGHHTIYSCAETGPIDALYYAELLPILERYHGVLDIYLAGHEHDVQLLQKISDPVYFDFVVSGAGGAFWDREIPGYDDVLRDDYGINKTFFSVVGSFVAMEATKDFLDMTFVDSNVTEMHSYKRYNTKRR